MRLCRVLVSAGGDTGSGTGIRSALETAVGVATVGDMASTANAALLDKACEDAD
jgi:hypothetical protein